MISFVIWFDNSLLYLQSVMLIAKAFEKEERIILFSNEMKIFSEMYFYC